MNLTKYFLSWLLVCIVSTGWAQKPSFTQVEFVELLNTVSTGWNTGDARKAADCFTSNAVYSEPPDKQLYKGRQALYEFFGGDAGRTTPMSMEWHHIAFNTQTNVGLAEWTFKYGSSIAHGVVVVGVRDGKIANWREYFYESDLDWSDFINENKF